MARRAAAAPMSSAAAPMSKDSKDLGVVFPTVDGRRSTARTGQAIVTAALQRVDARGADEARRESDWRTRYLTHFRRLVEAGLPTAGAAVTIASDGLAELHRQMRVATADGEAALAELFDQPVDPPAEETIKGDASPERELTVPYRHQRLRGDALHRQLDRWVGAGIAEPAAAEAVRTVMRNPDWLRVADHQLVLLGAAAEMSPLQALLRWGATVTAIDLPSQHDRLEQIAQRGAGELRALSIDLLTEAGTLAKWLAEQPGPLAVGNYVYADGALNVRVNTAVDAALQRVKQRRSDVTEAFLATPTDVFAVPREAVKQSRARFCRGGVSAMLWRRPVRWLSRDGLLSPAYPPQANPGVNDALVAQQGPNYALAKRLQRWRATAERSRGGDVSLNVAPPTRTRSVVKNRLLAAGYAGAHRFGIEVFEPGTSNTLMAALLVHDLHQPSRHTVPWQFEAENAVHGGFWRAAYAPRSALGLAVLVGLTGARS